MLSDDYDVLWSGGEGLTSYDGGSSLHHSPAWAETLEHGEAKDKRRYPHVAHRAKHWEHHEAALILLRKGCSYGAIAKQLGCSLSIPRRVAKQHGMDRRKFSDCVGHRA